jgi:hypothetical protein
LPSWQHHPGQQGVAYMGQEHMIYNNKD